MESLGEIASLEEIRKPLEKFADVNGGRVELEQPLGENSDRNHSAGQNGPHEEPTLLHVVDHALLP